MPFVFDGRHLLICFIIGAIASVAGMYMGWILKEENYEDKR